MLEIEQVKKSYGKIQALDGISLKIREGEVFGVIGQNGAGKTTLLKVMAGILNPDEGRVFVNGVALEEKSAHGKFEIGYVPDQYQLYDRLKVMEYMEFYAGLYGINVWKNKKWLRQLLEMVHLEDTAKMYVENLSQEMRRKLGVARALISDPKILILDEPGSGMDPKARVEFKKTVQDLCGGQRTIVISSHMVSGLPDYCTSVGILEEGKMILEGSMETVMSEIKKNQPLIIQVLGGQEQAVAIIKACPQVKKLSMEQNTFTVIFEGTDEEEAKLLSALIEGNVLVQKFYRETGDLESRFLDLIS
jgi:ABC-2 type transport system ATP-binding protein